MEESIRKADILIEAIPYIQAFRGKVIVAKYGGSAIDNPAAMHRILQDLVFLSEVGIRAVLVHGGGPEISRKLSHTGRQSGFIDGLRVTDAETIRVVNRALEEVNRRLVGQIESLGGAAVGASMARFDPDRLDISIGAQRLVARGAVLPVSPIVMRHLLDHPMVEVIVHLHAGSAQARMLTCDLTEEYVRINAGYAT